MQIQVVYFGIVVALIGLCPGLSIDGQAQSVEILGSAKVSEMGVTTTGNANVIRQDDGTLAVRKYEVGDFVQGGIVFWVDATGEHGLACAKLDQSASIRWYAGSLVSTQAKGDGPFAGEMNTAINVAGHAGISDDGALHAARMCVEFMATENGFSYGDWYLPSKAELHLMQQHRSVIDSTALANGGTSFTAFASYWSSTENSSSHAWSQNISTGVQATTTKSATLRVRAIRAF